MTRISRCAAALALDLALLIAAADTVRAEDPVSFKGKLVTILVGFSPGGGADASARVIAPYLARLLPGNPTVIVQNMPGADGLSALNYFVQQVKPDGLVAALGAGSQFDPIQYRLPNSHYDPTRFAFVGGFVRGGTVLLINRDAERRLHDHAAAPVIMGVNGAPPRTGMLMAVWGIGFLDWHAKWVLGYGETNAVMLALENGEIDMTATGNLFQIKHLTDTGRFAILTQSGMLRDGKVVPRPDFGDAPVLSTQLQGKLPDATAESSFAYWRAANTLDKWLALPPGTPVPVVESYRTAFSALAADPEFIALGKKISDDFTPQDHRDLEPLVDAVAAVTPAAVEYTNQLLRQQGVNVQ
jgi:hypothetical protein